MSVQQTVDFINFSIQAEITRRAAPLIEAAITEAKEKVDVAIRATLAEVALTVLREFEVSQGRDFVTIRVANKVKP